MGGRELPILRGITMDVSEGDFVAFMGPSGSGKSTLLHLIGTLDRPTSGTIEIGGRDVTHYKDAQLARLRNQIMGFVFQSFYLLPYYTALENVCLPLVYSGKLAQRRKVAARLLEHVGLGHRANHRPNELSGGERQRVAIARALVNKPSILCADEPTGNLDSKTGEIVMEFLKEINQQGTTVILITHDSHVASQANHIMHMKDGVFE